MKGAHRRALLGTQSCWGIQEWHSRAQGLGSCRKTWELQVGRRAECQQSCAPCCSFFCSAHPVLLTELCQSISLHSTIPSPDLRTKPICSQQSSTFPSSTLSCYVGDVPKVGWNGTAAVSRTRCDVQHRCDSAGQHGCQQSTQICELKSLGEAENKKKAKSSHRKSSSKFCIFSLQPRSSPGSSALRTHCVTTLGLETEQAGLKASPRKKRK